MRLSVRETVRMFAQCGQTGVIWLDVGTSDDMESFFMLTEKHGCCGICNPQAGIEGLKG